MTQKMTTIIVPYPFDQSVIKETRFHSHAFEFPSLTFIWTTAIEYHGFFLSVDWTFSHQWHVQDVWTCSFMHADWCVRQHTEIKMIRKPYLILKSS